MKPKDGLVLQPNGRFAHWQDGWFTTTDMDESELRGLGYEETAVCEAVGDPDRFEQCMTAINDEYGDLSAWYLRIKLRQKAIVRNGNDQD